jgi:hypothetical protein
MITTDGGSRAGNNCLSIRFSGNTIRLAEKPSSIQTPGGVTQWIR